MHHIKRHAHSCAWYGDGKSPNYNPFGRTRTSSSQINPTDVEAGLPNGSLPNGLLSGDSLHSGPVGTPGTQDEHGRVQPKQVNTMRPTSSGGEKISSESPIADTEKGQQSSNTRGNTDRTLVPDEPSTELSTSQPRRRKTGGFLKKLHIGSTANEGAKGSEASKLKNKTHFTVWGQIKSTLFNSWINVLLVMAPVGIALHFAHVDPVIVFVVNFIAIIPLAAMLSYATEEIALRTTETIGGLLNATFGNAVELIVSIIALLQGQITIVQTSLIGSILSNLLLVMGMCFFFGGLNRVKQHFNVTVAQTASSLLALAIGSLIIPTAFVRWARPEPPRITEKDIQRDVIELSRGTSILLLLVYGAYLLFQLKTHAALYNEPSKKVGKRRVKAEKGDANRGIAQMGANMSAASGGEITQENHMQLEEEKEEPQLSFWVAIFTLGASTTIVALCAEFMVDSIDALTKGPNGISKTFVGLILLPIVGNAAEHATAVTVAVKDKMDLAIGVAVGSSMQIALFVLPFIVVLGWIIGPNKEPAMSLNFDGFEITVVFVAVLLVNYLIGDGECHWLEGVLLMVLYLIIAIAAWYYPAPPDL